MGRRLHHLAAHVCASAGETARKTIARQQDEIERLKAQLAAQQRPEPQPTAAAPDDAPILDGVLVIGKFETHWNFWYLCKSTSIGKSTCASMMFIEHSIPCESFLSRRLETPMSLSL